MTERGLSRQEQQDTAAFDLKRFRYEKETDPQWLAKIEQDIKIPKFVIFEFEGKRLKIEYIEVPAKDSPERKEGEQKGKVIILIPGFSASYIPYAPAVRELAQYLGDFRIICLSPLDSGKSSPLKGSTLEKMNQAYGEAFKQMGIDQEHSQATIVGHSRSDIIALGLAAKYPDLVKHIVLVSGVSANPSNFPLLAYQFTSHTLARITPQRVLNAFKGEREVAENYWRQTIDFLKNMLKFPKVLHQINSLRERRRVDLPGLLSSLKSDVLILSGADDLTSPLHTNERIYQAAPKVIGIKHSVEFDGLHDEINAHPETFALKVTHWLSSLDKK